MTHPFEVEKSVEGGLKTEIYEFIIKESLHPPGVIIISLMEYVLLVKNICVGFLSSDVCESSKSHEYEDPLSAVELSVKFTVRGEHPLKTSPSNSIIGLLFMIIVFSVSALDPVLPVTINFTIKLPVSEYICVGFSNVEDVLSPKSHSQAVIVFPEYVDVLLKMTVSPVHISLEVVKFAVGLSINNVVVNVFEQPPPIVIVVKVTVKSPPVL